ncbi:hypothetical protein NDU88_001509 [Pleurodeles waltl]|uniref:Kinetochore protein SPC25 n=1 Tax=Pleurodeles waltl TaxID=8319 RepID=A0AAV7V8N7_PLEWA|nr:hypothetical protein NDU88_001509 [Pleurodeles waltl]
MDTKISDLVAESRSIRTDIAGFQNKVTGMKHRLSLKEEKLNLTPNRDQELQYLGDKLTDLRARSRRDNLHFFGFLECVEGTDVKAFLIATLPILTCLTFSPLLEIEQLFQMALCLKDRPRPIIACFLRHEQVRQLLTAARAHRPHNFDG